ncbi:MAG: D-alanine--D-alanine ligase, partial [Alphaproteobacteria bacterium]|nr:D-alanine--D-alanine ligase [Alphaproteobacteria bacterium]
MRHSGGLSDNTRVAVLRGGWSPEREVSLKSGAAVIASLQRQNYDVIEIDPVKDLTRFAAQLVSARPHVVFNALHGTGGEDGIIAGALEMAGIPYTHSGVGASAVAMDKKLTKMIAAQIGIPVAIDKIMTRGELQNGHPLPPPYVVKPISDGSSVGVTIVQNDIGEALRGDAEQKILIEKYIPGIELTVGV